MVIVREVEGLIVGVQYVSAHKDYIMLEMLARNKLLDYPGAGGDLVRVVERVIAPQIGVREIRMDALEHVVKYYDDVLGTRRLEGPIGTLTGVY